MWFTSRDDKKFTAIGNGAEAEVHAEQFLMQQGLITRAKNYRGKHGEIDLIMSQGTTLVFIEVRLRTNKRFTSAAATVDYRKQQKIIKTAQQFLQAHNLVDAVPCRFDVLALDQNTQDIAHIEWIKDAFST